MADSIIMWCAVVATIGIAAMVVAISMAVVAFVFKVLLRPFGGRQE